MSTFLGLIKEIPGVSVDRFDGENLTSSVFFLSHCHIDHMQGLSDLFFMHLDDHKKYLYCSPITKELLKNRFKFRSSSVKEINVNTSTIIEYFIFERNNLSILYTGDFRINPLDFPKLKGLHYYEDSKLIPRTFTKIYLDTTFLSNDFPSFPTRQESMVKICEITKEWLGRDPRNVVILECSATYGSEFLFVELSKMMNVKIHVKHNVYESYCCITQLSCYVTNDPYSTPIHACKRKISSSGLHCRSDVSNANIMTIIPSVMKWKKRDTSVVGEWDKIKERTFNVCYSTHSSFNELKAFIQYFNTLDIYPCVVKTEEEKEVYRLLDSIKKISDEQVAVKETYELKLPNRKVLNKIPLKSEYFSSDDDSF
ncbi:PREDICTED: protein artemis-like [Habropoda laboriosa]|uniref:protein artemis-like n=1 Tax=Habropoda laboriosa TaxID=597456 RepID=UPI00083E4446|nr:PREDICTED: protein artemis-like [Habropoda laboriosa]